MKLMFVRLHIPLHLDSAIHGQVDRLIKRVGERQRPMNNQYISKQPLCMSCQHTLTPLTPRRDYSLASGDRP